MPIPPTLREDLSESIGTVLSRDDEFERIVRDATGKDAYVKYTSRGLPRAVQVSQTLAQLEREGNERWLLTYVLVLAARDERLRRLIVKACPQTMDSSIRIDDQVNDVLKNWDAVLACPLAREIRYDLRDKRSDFDTVLRQSVELLYYKRLQELLLRLHTKLTFGIALEQASDEQLDGPRESTKLLLDACQQARDAMALLDLAPEERDFELKSIAELEKLGGDVNAALDRGDSSAVLTAMVALQRLIRQHLSRLNGFVFDLAKRLPLAALIERPPMSLEDSFNSLTYAVRDLAPTILARVLLRKMWQEAINEISLISDLLDAGLTEKAEFSEHWYSLKSRIRWLSALEPESPWSKSLHESSAKIDDKLADEKTQGGLQPLFEDYRRAVALGFSAVMLKIDFACLEKINPKLKSVLEEIGHV